LNDDARKRKSARLVEQWQRAVRAAIQGTRKDRHLSQEDLAALLGWTRNMIANIESGRREISVAEFIVLAGALEIAPEVLFRRVLSW